MCPWVVATTLTEGDDIDEPNKGYYLTFFFFPPNRLRKMVTEEDLSHS
jgi:hypothetical protein